MGKIRSAFRFLFRFAAIWLADAVSLSLTAWFLPGIGLGNYAGLPVWMVAFAAALLLGAVNLVVRPLILLVVMRQGFIILLVVGFFVNAVMLRLTAALMGGGLTVDGWFPAIAGGIVLAVGNMIVSGLVGIDDQTGSFLLHPADMIVPPTRSSTDIFGLLNARPNPSRERVGRL